MQFRRWNHKTLICADQFRARDLWTKRRIDLVDRREHRGIALALGVISRKLVEDRRILTDADQGRYEIELCVSLLSQGGRDISRDVLIGERSIFRWQLYRDGDAVAQPVAQL